MITNASVFAPKHELLSLSWTHYLPDSFCDKVAYTGLAVNRRKKTCWTSNHLVRTTQPVK